MEFSSFEETFVCRETIYNAIYALPVGYAWEALIAEARSPT